MTDTRSTHTEDRKDVIIHWRADAALVKRLDEGAEQFGTRSEFIRRALWEFRFR